MDELARGVDLQLSEVQELMKEGHSIDALQEAVSALRLSDVEVVEDRVEHLTQLLKRVRLTSHHCGTDFSNSILAESGREDMNTFALEDGTCFLCASCGGVVVTSRREAHFRYWCQNH